MSLKNYCFTGIPHFLCSQNPSSSTQMPVPQLLHRKTAASTRFTVSQVFQRQGARRTPPAIHQCPFRSFCIAKLQRALVLLFNRCSNARVLAEPLALHQCLIRSFCNAKLQRALVLLFHRNTAPFVLAFPGLRQSQNQCFVKHFSCKLHTNWHVIF